MDDRKKHIDDLFLEGLRDYRETPPAEVWASLEKRLPAQGDDNSSSGKRLWLLLLLLLLGTAGSITFRKLSETGVSEKTAHAPGSTTAGNGSPLPTEDNSFSKNAIAGSDKDEAIGESAIIKTEHNAESTHRAENGISKAQREQSPKNASPKIPEKTINAEHRTHKTAGKTKQENNRISSINRKNKTAAASDKNGNKGKTSEGSGESAHSFAATTSENSLSKKLAQEESAAKTPASKNAKRNRLSTDRLSANDYLMQTVPDDEEESDTANDGEYIAQKKSPDNTSEDEVKKNLNYIPPDESLVPVASSSLAKPTKEQKRLTADTQNKSEDKNALLLANNKSSDAKGIGVRDALSGKDNTDVEPAQFKKKTLSEKNIKFARKSKLSVQSDVATNPNEKIDFKPQAKKIATRNAVDNRSHSNLSASGNDAAVQEETSSSQPSSGGGGGGASALKNGSKFRFDLGVKAGYEHGFAKAAANSFIIAPYLQWNISTGFAFVFQPGFRYNQINGTAVSDVVQSYHNITTGRIDTAHVYSADSQGAYVQRNYTFHNSYDSIVVGSALRKKNYWEIELPVMLRYKIASNFAIFGGMSLMFGNLINMEETRTTAGSFQKSSTLSFPKESTLNPAPALPSALDYFSYNTSPISSAPPAAETPAGNPARFGLMFGFSYELQKRISIDVLYRQTVSDMKYIPNDAIRKIYTQPYFRVMVGFKLFGQEEEKEQKPEGF